MTIHWSSFHQSAYPHFVPYLGNGNKNDQPGVGQRYFHEVFSDSLFQPGFNKISHSLFQTVSLPVRPVKDETDHNALPLFLGLGALALAAFSLPRLSLRVACVVVTALAAASCSDQTPTPDEPLPFPGEDSADGGYQDSDAGSGDLDAGEIPTCVPEECAGFVDPDRTKNGEGLCIAFKPVEDQALKSEGDHNNISISDVNNDGRPDLYLLKAGAPNQLLLNFQHGFVDATASFGLYINNNSRKAVWNDLDGDGDEDLFLVGESGSQLYEKDGAFFHVPASGGIYNAEFGKAALWIGSDLFLSTDSGTRYYKFSGSHSFNEIPAADIGLGDPGDGSELAAADYDQDGDADIYLANSAGRNRFFLNLGNGNYESIEQFNGTEGIGNSIDAQWVELKAGQPPSLYVANWNTQNHLFVRNPDGTFSDRAPDFGLTAVGQTVKARWKDFLSEGKPALFVGRWNQQNLLYVPVLTEEGQAVTGYKDIAHPLGLDATGETIGAEWLDYDNDSKLDLLVVMHDGAVHLFRNQTHKVKTCPN